VGASLLPKPLSLRSVISKDKGKWCEGESQPSGNQATLSQKYENVLYLGASYLANTLKEIKQSG